MIELLLSETLSPHTYNCTWNDTLTGVFLWIYLCENIFSLLNSRKYAFTDVLQHICSWNVSQNSQKNACTRLSLLRHRCFPENFLKGFMNSFFTEHLWMTASDFKSNLLTVFKRFCLRIDRYLFKIPGYFRVYQNSLPPGPLGLHTFFTLNKYYCGKDYNCIKKFMIFISKSMLTISTKCPRVLNIPRFWICLCFWRFQGSE